jgi:hypothetical protein
MPIQNGGRSIMSIGFRSGLGSIEEQIKLKLFHYFG